MAAAGRSPPPACAVRPRPCHAQCRDGGKPVMTWDDPNGQGLRLAAGEPMPWDDLSVAMVLISRGGAIETAHTVTGKRRMLEPGGGGRHAPGRVARPQKAGRVRDRRSRGGADRPAAWQPGPGGITGTARPRSRDRRRAGEERRQADILDHHVVGRGRGGGQGYVAGPGAADKRADEHRTGLAVVIATVSAVVVVPVATLIASY